MNLDTNSFFVGIGIAVLFLICIGVLIKLVFKTNTVVNSEEFSNSSDETENIDESRNEAENGSENESTNKSENETYESKTISVNTGSNRRDSKIGSSLEFAYIDESCEEIGSNDEKSLQITSFPSPAPGPGPTIPITVSTKCSPCKNSQNDQTNQKEEDSDLVNKNPEVMPHADLYDKYLEPNPNTDSPYGFVFFPNKYWKQWQTKAPVCIPTTPCKVQPTCTNGVPVDVLDYTQVGSIMPKFEYKEEYKE